MFPILLIASVLSESVVETVNNDPTSTWVAVEYPASIITYRKFRAMLGEEVQPELPITYAPSNDLPEYFDAREAWPGKIFAVRDQVNCGACWAFAQSETAGNRLSIKGCSYGMLSPQDLVSCDTVDAGCRGGSGPTSSQWVESHGVTTDACLPYVSASGRVPACPAQCSNGTSILRYKYGKAQNFTVNDIQRELMTNGPVYFRFSIYTDFMSYKSGVYQHKTGKLEGGHAVLLIGWGVEDGIPYWLLQNSWGPNWGEQGHFKFIRGRNECGCENGFYAGTVSC